MDDILKYERKNMNSSNITLWLTEIIITSFLNGLLQNEKLKSAVPASIKKQQTFKCKSHQNTPIGRHVKKHHKAYLENKISLQIAVHAFMYIAEKASKNLNKAV